MDFVGPVSLLSQVHPRLLSDFRHKAQYESTHNTANSTGLWWCKGLVVSEKQGQFHR